MDCFCCSNCGKITTPVHVVDKSTKLHTLFDRIHLIDTRFGVLKRDAEIAMLRGISLDEVGRRSGLAVPFLKGGLGIEQIHLARPAFHEHEDDVLRFLRGPGRIDRDVNLLEKVGNCSDVVFVAVRNQERPQLLLVGQQVGKIRNEK